MELAGPEPATSWVRFRRVEADSRLWRVLEPRPVQQIT